MNREAWLAERKTGLGSSDAAPICGLSPFNSPYGVYLDKTNQLPDQPMNDAMKWGLWLEPVLSRAYEERTGEELITTQKIYRHPKLPWMLCSPDRVNKNGQPRELKTCNAYAKEQWGEEGTDEIPDHYNVQVQHQLAVMDQDAADVAVLIGGSDFRVYHIKRSESAIASLIDIEAAFWERVEKRLEPEPDWAHPHTLRILKSLFGNVEESLTVTLGEEFIEAADLLAHHKSHGKEHADLADEYKAKLLFAMGNAAKAILPDGRTLTRKTIRRNGYAVPACEFIQFSVKEPKKGKVPA